MVYREYKKNNEEWVGWQPGAEDRRPQVIQSIPVYTLDEEGRWII